MSYTYIGNLKKIRCCEVMMIDWEQAWKDAQSGSMLTKRKGGEGKWTGYFDDIAQEYLETVMSDEAYYRRIAGFVKREGFFRNGDRVFDLACGPGTYTLLFAEHAGSVTSLDPSPGMLGVLKAEAARRELKNISTVQSRWEDYEGDEKYDLVFTALSPGVTGPETFLKLERFSRRSCCYIGFGEASNNKLGDRLWELVIGSPRKNHGFNVTYPFNLLHSIGRRPCVRFFDQESMVREPSDELIESNIEWLGLFTGMDEAKKEIVREYVHSISKNGYYRHKARQSLVVLLWDVPDSSQGRSNSHARQKSIRRKPERT